MSKRIASFVMMLNKVLTFDQEIGAENLGWSCQIKLNFTYVQ